MFVSPASSSKPSLRRAGGVWFCTNGGISAQGPTAKDAYRAYEQQRRVMNQWMECDPHAPHFGTAGDRSFVDVFAEEGIGAPLPRKYR